MYRSMTAILCASLALAATVSLASPQVHSDILTSASAKAKASHKLVFVSFSASWCGPCRLLHKTLEHAPVKPIWDKYFVSAPVIVDENGDKAKLNTQGGNELRMALHGDQAGIPFFAFLTPDGYVQGDSYITPGKDNMGCPMSPDEIVAFMKTLKKVAPKMTAAERATIETAFKTAKP